jgi:DNA-binding Xre family transcriptional regulator
MAAAERGVWTATQLRHLLAERAHLELSAASVSVLFTKQPAQVKLSTLTALCTALDCAPGDLLTLPATEPPGLLPPPPERTLLVGPAAPTEPRRPGQAHQAGTSHRSLPPL